MNEKSLKKLEYDKIIGFLINECSSPLGKERAEQYTKRASRFCCVLNIGKCYGRKEREIGSVGKV